ncbi:MAG TPA: hypothetical protein VNM22_01050 [Candidatus Limnocylindrales bacterium]|nr:hypothetical protein [Candidatus Limnocylindrales bacterium]
MAFTIQEYLDLVRLLGEHPEWRSELRRLLLSDDLLALPEIVRALAEAQQRTEEQLRALAEAQRRTDERLEALTEAQRRTEVRLEALAEAQQRTEEQLRALAEAQRRTEERLEALAAAQQRSEERLERLEAIVRELAEAQRRTEERLEALAEAQRRTDERLEALTEAQRRTEVRLEALAEAQRRTEERLERLEAVVHELVEVQRRTVDTVGDLKGRMLEITYREKAGAYFGLLLKRVQVVMPQTLEEVLEAHLSPEAFKELLLLDLLINGQPRYHPDIPEVWLAVEISAVVDQQDVTRARQRALLLRQAGYRVIPVVAGERTTLGAEDEARFHKVAILQDGRTYLWEEALQAWAAQ